MRILFVAGAVLALSAGAALADSVGVAGTWNGLYFGEYKTPPLVSTQPFAVPMSYHSTFAYSNWAGVVIDINIDPNPKEAQFVGALGAPGFFPTLYGMPTGSGSAAVVTFWHSQWQQSGISNGPASSPFPVGDFLFHATHTDPIYNSDIDITFSAWNIWHVTALQSSTSFAVPTSIWLYVPIGAPAGAWGQYPVYPGEGVWAHVTESFTAHVMASALWATNAFISGQGGVGVEHLPEPASAVILMGGLGSLWMARRRRQA